MNDPKDMVSEHDHLKEQARKILEDGSKIQAQVSVLRYGMRKIRSEASKLSQSKENNQSATAAILEAFAKADCSKFCEDVYCAFPREIRDTIYGCIYPEDEVSVPRRRYHGDR
ncbi:hypothetical protein EK21DRAFT_115688 [Setomelanomma holmii]|uniref:Uncharacterized protein n=1 Tax=Setomelanomma holmii TaxID=210430 RepID=A0A9P4H365_9PLEO|nr:hypothetical protein EK21DRAFT_115688 [Setomelanomma holmii]